MIEFKRLLQQQVLASLSAFPAVYIAGPRQAGKTTLVKHIAAGPHPANYISFDNIQVRTAATRDPYYKRGSLQGPVILDEFQLVPELFRPLKIIIDEQRMTKDKGRGKFLLTGSASVMALPKLSDALVGRLALHTLLPFSMREFSNGKQNTFIEYAFTKEWHFEKVPAFNLQQAMTQASFPELYELNSGETRQQWCNSYIETILQRDIKALIKIEKIELLPNMLRFIANQTGGLLNETSLSKNLGINHVTTKRYRLLLESLFLIHTIPAWSTNLSKRLIKAPKLYLTDMNLLAFLLNFELETMTALNSSYYGQLVENFVAIELTKQLHFSKINAQLYHYRTASGQEVDFLLEGPEQQIVGIEVKARKRITDKDFRHLETLQSELGKKFRTGFIIYTGNEVIPFGKDLWAIPISSLWSD